MQQKAERQARDAEFWQGVNGLVEGAVAFLIGLAVAVAIALACLGVGWGTIRLLSEWDTRQAERYRLQPDGRGLVSISIEAGDAAALMGMQGHHAAAIEAAKQPRLSSELRTYAPRYYEGKQAPAQLAAPAAPALPAPDAPLALPGPVDLSTLDFTPSLSSILLAIGPGGHLITVEAKNLVHCGVTGSTGQGKSNIVKMLIAQLAASGAGLLLADPHFARVDPDSGEDWAPIERRLLQPPAVAYSDIGDMLQHLARVELPARLERRRHSQPVGQPIYCAIDELPAIAAKVKDAPEYIGEILREGRKAQIFLLAGAQDLLLKSIGTSSGIRDCLRTGYYCGADPHTARALLDMPAKLIDESLLGKGLVYLRSKPTPQAALVRVPYVSNDSLYKLLPPPAQGAPAPVARPTPLERVTQAPPIMVTSPTRAQDLDTPQERPPLVVLRGGCTTTTTTDPDEAAPTAENEAEHTTTTTTTTTTVDPDDERRARIRQLASEGVSRSSIAHILWGYKDTRVMSIIRDALAETEAASVGD